ncbi:MAG: hypothetical protein JRF33_17005 [Deltaproteobacteria bacterium]|nr:hypothetical protein [Deltaproteobacteria bacterium]
MKLKNSIAILGMVLLAGRIFAACNQPADFPQVAKDRALAYTLFYSAVDLFNFTMPQQAMGNHNFDTSCPNGGTVHIEGTTQFGDTVAVDVSYDMQDCGFNKSDHMEGLTLNGKLLHTANYDSAGLGGEDLFSENLRIEGSLFAGTDQAEIDMECEIELSYIESEISKTLLGIICGRHTSLPLWHVTGEEEE